MLVISEMLLNFEVFLINENGSVVKKVGVDEESVCSGEIVIGILRI